MTGYVERVDVRARLDDPEPSIRAAKSAAARGDECWSRWLAELSAGLALVVHLQVTARYVGSDGRNGVVERRNAGVWTLRTSHVPEYEAQLQEIANKDACELGRDLRAAGLAVTDDQIAAMAAHIALDPGLRDQLVRAPETGDPGRGGRACADDRPRVAPEEGS